MPRLFRWQITKHAYEKGDVSPKYIGHREGCFLLGHGYVMDSPKFMDGTFIHTSGIQRMDYVEENGWLRLHTKNSVYDCALADCDFAAQAPLAELPFSPEAGAEKYRFGNWGAPERDSVLLVFADYMEYGLVTALADRQGVIVPLETNLHLGMLQDSCLIAWPWEMAKDILPEQRLDIRFFPLWNYIEFYQCKGAGLPVWLHNAGQKKLRFGMGNGQAEMELAPGERKEFRK